MDILLYIAKEICQKILKSENYPDYLMGTIVNQKSPPFK